MLSFLGGHTDLHVFPRGTVIAHVYTGHIIDAYVHHYAGEINNDCLLQDDSATRLIP